MTGALRPVALLGLGRMGLPMSVNLARAGYPVRAWNRSSREIGVIDGDLIVLDTPAAAGAGTDVLVTMLPDLDQVIEVCEGPIGALTHATPGAVVLVMGTVCPVRLRIWAKTVVDRGFRVVDAPVSGGDVGARSGQLSIMAGGRDEDVARSWGHCGPWVR